MREPLSVRGGTGQPITETGLPRAVTWAALALLSILTLVRGVEPALSRVDTDFPNYLTAAKLVAEGRAGPALYDDAWFRREMSAHGMAPMGKFSPFPPPTALLLLPLASLSPLTALRVMTVLSLLALVAAIFLLSRLLEWSVVECAVGVLLAGGGLFNGLRFGQPYILMSALCILGMYAWQRHRPWLAGICLGVFVPIKYYPVVYGLGFALARQWRVVLGGLAAALGVLLLSVGVLGWALHDAFLRGNVLGRHLIADLSGQDPYAVAFQSFDTLFRRLLILDPAANPHPWMVAPALEPVAVLMCKMVVGFATVLTLYRMRPGGAADALAPTLGLLGLTVFLLAPATASYHFVLLWLPVGLLFTYLWRRGQRLAAGCLGAGYALIGFFPYGLSHVFEGRGGLTVLAFPRLLLLLGMFGVCVQALRRSPWIAEGGGG